MKDSLISRATAGWKSIFNRDKQFFIVDYDIPRVPSSKRRAFYRHLRQLKKKMGLFDKMSTMSVLITVDRELAEKVYRLATEYGQAHIYTEKNWLVAS